MARNRITTMTKVLVPIGVALYLVQSYLRKGNLDITDLISVVVMIVLTLALFFAVKLILK